MHERYRRLAQASRCPVCSGRIVDMDMHHDVEQAPDRPDGARFWGHCLYIACENGCRIRTRNKGTEAFLKRLRSWLEFKDLVLRRSKKVP